MTDTSENWFQTCVNALTDGRDQRVWSVIVSLFGDLARTPGDRISGPLMNAIIGPIGIRPEAIRVALHRLRNDGWLTSEREGRTGFYALTPGGLKESEAASPRIYARDEPSPETWHLIILEPMATTQRTAQEKRLIREGRLLVAPGALLGRGEPGNGKSDGFILSGRLENVPQWLREQVSKPELAEAYAGLVSSLRTVSDVLDLGYPATALQVATLRTLIVHNWRRILLAHPDLPPEFFVDGWQGAMCRKQVMQLLDRLERPAPNTLQIAQQAA